MSQLNKLSFWTGVLEEYKHCWLEQLSIRVNTTEKGCMAVGPGFDDRNVGLLIFCDILASTYLRTSYSLSIWIRNYNSTTTSTKTESKSKVGSLLTDNFIRSLTFTFFFAQLDFPAVTICNQNRVHCGNLDRLIQEQGNLTAEEQIDISKMCSNAGCSCPSMSRGSKSTIQKRGTGAVQASGADDSNGENSSRKNPGNMS